MNRQIAHLFGLFILLFALLVAWTSRWTVFEAESLKEQTSNRRSLLREQQVPRGLVVARDGTVLARSVQRGSRNNPRYVRDYPLGQLFGHPVGYAFITQDRSGMERSYQSELTGEDDEFSDIVDQILGRGQEGQDLRTTLDPNAQRTALQALGGRKGAVVALEPETGRVRAMVSVPTYDPNQVPDRFRELNADRNAPLFNRTTQAGYPPGSTFKVVTAVAALDSGRYKPDSIVDGRSPKRISGVPLSNCCGEGTGDFPPLPLTEALANSVNTVWAEVGEKLGKDTMYDYMERFGFNTEPPLDYPRDQLVPSGVFGKGGKLLDASDPVDIGRVAIGQERLRVTPLQMAMVASAVANGGVLMEPRLAERVVAKDGRVTDRIRPEEMDRVMKEETASAVASMMQGVVDRGTATSAKIGGVAVAGKTGTAEVEQGATNQAWFIGFAPVERPRVAVAVTVERTQGQGGTVAAPIAKQVMEVLLRGE